MRITLSNVESFPLTLSWLNLNSTSFWFHNFVGDRDPPKWLLSQGHHPHSQLNLEVLFLFLLRVIIIIIG